MGVLWHERPWQSFGIEFPHDIRVVFGLCDLCHNLSVFALQVDNEEKPRIDPRTVLSIILGGGASTRLFPLTKRHAKPVVRATPFHVTLSVAIKLVGTQVWPPLFSIQNSSLCREKVVSLNQKLELVILGVWYLASWQACIQRLWNYWELDPSSPFQ